MFETRPNAQRTLKNLLLFPLDHLDVSTRHAYCRDSISHGLFTTLCFFEKEISMMNIKNKLLIIVACLGISTSSASTITEWSHNGSVMTTSWTDTTIKILYKEPRKEMQDAGARSGSVLVEGIITGDDIKGTAKIFAGRCGSFTYPVQGRFSHDNRKISLKGFAPVVDRSNCKTLRTVTDLLEFNYIDIKLSK